MTTETIIYVERELAHKKEKLELEYDRLKREYDSTWRNPVIPQEGNRIKKELAKAVEDLDHAVEAYNDFMSQNW